MDANTYRRGLRDLVNVPSSVMATPGAKAGELAAAEAGERAGERAKAFGAETRTGLKELALKKQDESWGREMEIGEQQSDRALIYAGLGSAIKLGSAHLLQKKVDEIVERQMGQIGILNELDLFSKARLGEFLTVMGKRKAQQKGAYTGTGE